MAATQTALAKPNPFQGEPYHPYRETAVPFTARDGIRTSTFGAIEAQIGHNQSSIRDDSPC